MPEVQCEDAVFLARQPVWQIFWSGCKLYASHWKVLTRPLIVPVLQIILGAYACIILNYLFIDGLSEVWRAFFQQNLILLALVMLVITSGTLFWFFRGFWEYLIYLASFNINATEAIQNQPLHIKVAYDVLLARKQPYQKLLLLYCLLPVVVALPFISLSLLGAFAMPLLSVILSLSGFLLSAILGCLWLIVLVFLTLIFQVIALEEAPVWDPLALCMRSARLVWTRPLGTLGLQMALMLLTGYLLPLPVIILFRIFRVAGLLDAAHLWIIQLVLKGAEPQAGGLEPFPYYGAFFQLLQNHLYDLAQLLTDSLLGGVITGLLLPLGAIIFTQWYWACVGILALKAATKPSAEVS